jgi:hypothetical protein
VHFEDIALVDGGSEREGFLGGSILFKGGDGFFRNVIFRVKLDTPALLWYLDIHAGYVYAMQVDPHRIFTL